MSDISLIFNQAIDDSTRTLESLKKLERQVAKAAELIQECLRAGRKILACGNGGSAADASHFATELVVRFAKDPMKSSRAKWRRLVSREMRSFA